MNLFEDLVTDLQKENLLDNGVNENYKLSDNWSSLNFSKVETTTNSVFKEFSTFYDNSAFKLPEFKEVLPEESSLNQAQSATSNNIETSIPVNNDPVLLLSPEPPKKLRKVQLKAKKKGRYCKTCLIGVPYYRSRCRFCGERIAGGFYYYSIILLSILTLLTLIFAIIANKTYK